MDRDKQLGKKKGKNIAIVLAAGQGKRMGTKIQKQYLNICGKPMIYYSLKCFEESPLIDEVIMVTGQEELIYCKEEVAEKYQFRKVSKVIAGGQERYHSVYEGLKACEDCAYVFIHDGSRPFLNEGILKRTLEAAIEYRACVAAVPAKDTIKISDGQDFIKTTPVRSNVWVVQTPQVFEYSLVRGAYDKGMLEKLPGITDDAMVVEAMTSCPVRLVQGSYKNIKVTTPEDLEISEVFAKTEY